jgi:hypothetical protein
LPFNVPGLDFNGDVMQGLALHSMSDVGRSKGYASVVAVTKT